jgi:hypothetical protein
MIKPTADAVVILMTCPVTEPDKNLAACIIIESIPQ